MPPRPPKPSNAFHDNRHTYIPEHAKKIIERSAAAQPLGSPDSSGRLDVAQSFQASNHFQQLEDQQPPQPVAPVAPQPGTYATAPTPPAGFQPQPPAAPAQPYDFIMDPGKPPKSRLPLPGLNSTLKKVIFALVSLVVLLIIFNVVKGLLSGTSNTTFLVSVAQDQQEIIHLTSNATTTPQQNLTTADQNFAATTNASIVSAQLAIGAGLASVKYKVSPTQLNLKVSQQLDTQLTTAAANGTYDQTFRQVMKAQLTIYMGDLNQAYNKTSGKTGRALLQNDYSQAKLLLGQLDTPGQ